MQSIRKYEFYKHTSIAPHIRLQRPNECNNRTKKITLRMLLNMRSVSTNGWDYYKWTSDDIIPWCEQEPTDYILCVIQGRNSDSQYSFLASYFFTAAAATLLSPSLSHSVASIFRSSSSIWLFNAVSVWCCLFSASHAFYYDRNLIFRPHLELTWIKNPLTEHRVSWMNIIRNSFGMYLPSIFLAHSFVCLWFVWTWDTFFHENKHKSRRFFVNYNPIFCFILFICLTTTF